LRPRRRVVTLRGPRHSAHRRCSAVLGRLRVERRPQRWLSSVIWRRRRASLGLIGTAMMATGWRMRRRLGEAGELVADGEASRHGEHKEVGRDDGEQWRPAEWCSAWHQEHEWSWASRSSGRPRSRPSGCITLAVPRRAVPAITVVGRRVAPFRFAAPSAAASSGCAPARPSRSRAGFGPSGAGGTRSTRWPLRTRRAPPWWTCWPRRGQGPLAGAALLATTAACWSRASPASATTSCLEGRPRPRCPSMGSTMSAGWGPRHGRLGPVRFEGPMSATTPGSSGCSWPPWRRRPPASTPASRPAGTASIRRSACSICAT
jgi:hypothetical protein